MKFAIQQSHGAWLGESLADRVERTFQLIRTADQAGFDSLWLTEDPDGWDAMAVLGAAARETSSIRLGTGVTNPYMRHPNLIAASVATLDRLSSGRAFLGLGRGQPEWYQHGLGMKVESPLLAIETTVDLLHQWWLPAQTASGRDPFPVAGWERSIGPQSDDKPPIYLAATGPKMLQLAGRIANGVRFNELASVEFLTDAVVTVKASALAARRDPEGLAFFASPGIVVTDDPEPALERKKAFLATVLALPGMERQLQSPGIDVTGIMQAVRRHMHTEEILARGGGFPALRREGDLEAAKRAIPLELMERVAIVGPLPHVQRRVAELKSIGITHLFLEISHLVPDAQSVRAFATSLFPES